MYPRAVKNVAVFVLLMMSIGAVVKTSSAIRFPPHMIIPVMPLKVVGNPYEETDKLDPKYRCPIIEPCEIREPDVPGINKHLKEKNCPLIPICPNATSTTTTTPEPITTTTISSTTTSTTASTTTTVTTQAVPLEPLPQVFADFLCPYLQTDLKDKEFVKKNIILLTAIGCQIPSSDAANTTTDYADANPSAASVTAAVAAGTNMTNATEAVQPVYEANQTTTMIAPANATVVPSAVANVTDTEVAANGTSTTVGYGRADVESNATTAAAVAAAAAVEATSGADDSVVVQKSSTLGLGATIAQGISSIFKKL